MEAEFNGQDYFLFLEKKNEEIIKVKKIKLETKLTEPFRGVELKKRVTLEYCENDGPDGIELKYTPNNPNSWEAILEINIKINGRAYNHLLERGNFGTRYNGSDKIQIYNGNPRYEL
jgi:hypothetical protein